MVLVGLAIGFWIGWWSAGEQVDSRDFVALVSVLSTALVALYSVRSNRQSDQARRVHEERMLERRLVEERARGERQDAVDRLIEMKRGMRGANPVRVDFSEYHHPGGADEDTQSKLVGRAELAWDSALEATSYPEWFRTLGWTREIRETADDIALAIDNLEGAWLDLLHDYGVPPTPLKVCQTLRTMRQGFRMRGRERRPTQIA
jgi:hypothetical protein